MPIIADATSPNVSRGRELRKPTVRSTGGIAVAQNRHAAEIGARVLAEGGHAVDAAVAIGFAVGVLEPWMSGVGGVGAGLVYDAKSGRIEVIDFGATSPAALDPADFPIVGGADSDLFGWPAVKDNRNTTGARAVVAPTEPAGLALMHKRHGRKPWRALLTPAIRLAEEGPVVDWHTELMISSALGDLTRNAAAAARFLRGGVPPQPAAPQAGGKPMRLAMPELARTLGAIASDGAEVLYKGVLARSIADDVQALGGYLSTEDLAAVAPKVCDPLVIRYRGSDIHVTPELSGGPTLAVAYRDLEARRGQVGAAPDARAFADYAAAMRAGWTHRFDVMGDAGERTAPTSTTHFAVIDRDGNIVTLTQTLLSIFGSRVVLPGSGILMNNGVNWFDPRPGGPNSIAPGRRMLSNYAPAIMVGATGVTGIGGCGGRRILPAVFQLLALQAEFGFDLDRAFHTPRIDVSGLGPVVADRRLDRPSLEGLAKAFDVVIGEPSVLSNPFTVASAVARRDGWHEAATEPEHPWSDAVAAEKVGA